MVAPQVDQRAFDKLVATKFKPVARHLQGLGAELSAAFTSWFLCCFVTSLPMETCLRVWDLLFFHRSILVLFKVRRTPPASSIHCRASECSTLT